MTSRVSATVWFFGFLFVAAWLRAESPAPEAPSSSPPPGPRKAYNFSCTIEKPGLTSAGIYDSEGRLVRVLWTMKGAEAGPLEGKWNGKDDEGKAVSRGEYTWKVIVNRSKYENIGTIGNTGQPPTTSGHVPVYLAGVAVDSTNGVYTVQDWDEPHFSVIKWSANDGRAEFNTDNVVNEALLRVITVEPDGSYAYVTGYEDLSDRAKAKFSIWRLKLAPGKGNSKVEDFSKAGRKIRVYDGNAQFPENASVEDREVMNIPLRSLAILGSTLYATDALKGRVLLYDKESGELKKEFPVPLACGIALDPNGRIWVGHEHEKVSVLSADGKVLATPITDLKDVWALALRGDKLYVADREQGQVRIYQVKGNDVVTGQNFWRSRPPGRPCSGALYEHRGDGSGPPW